MKAHDTPRRIRPYKAATHTPRRTRTAYAHDRGLLALTPSTGPYKGMRPPHRLHAPAYPPGSTPALRGLCAASLLTRGLCAAHSTPPEGSLTCHPHIPKAVTLVFYTPQK